MNRRLQLINWVRECHEGQLIKETGQPYFDHLLTVANAVAGASPLTFEIGICHDLLEKTAITEVKLKGMLIQFGYLEEEANHICACVTQLTRQFTKEASPLPKKERKDLEHERLLTISADAQTVKYADLAYNATWMMQYDRYHASAYLRRMIELIKDMTAGDSKLQNETLKLLRQFLNELQA